MKAVSPGTAPKKHSRPDDRFNPVAVRGVRSEGRGCRVGDRQSLFSAGYPAHPHTDLWGLNPKGIRLTQPSQAKRLSHFSSGKHI